VYRVDKSKDCNKSGEALSTFSLEKLSYFITSTTPVESLRIQLLTQGTLAFLSVAKVVDPRKNSFAERIEPLRNIRKGSRAGCKNRSWFNRIFMKLPVKIYLCRSGRVWIVDMQRFTCPNTI
jgi:hypothetical protein